ncbi:LbetaH domain-containing protein [Catenuloplanes japonicus]|uniref:hypothetical protein n=1 Tax=Catenuloplanes japonicus TaxID=33876 RepID=UPI00052537D9|nr:hypothetical protein [Catenuloplanes japonicus]
MDERITIGRGSVIGAGAAGTANIPPMVVAAGVPARVLRPITDADRTWTYRPPAGPGPARARPAADDLLDPVLPRTHRAPARPPAEHAGAPRTHP